MKKTFVITILMVLAVTIANAQTALKKVYDETIDPMEQIDKAIVKAKAEKKFVICQLGGNWCPWCLKFADFAVKNEAVSKVIADNFVYLHVNYNPRKAGDEAAKQKAAKLMKRLDNPARFGFPVFVILDAEGKVIHTQDSSFLEEGSSYSETKVLRFLNCWTPGCKLRSK